MVYCLRELTLIMGIQRTRYPDRFVLGKNEISDLNNKYDPKKNRAEDLLNSKNAQNI